MRHAIDAPDTTGTGGIRPAGVRRAHTRCGPAPRPAGVADAARLPGTVPRAGDVSPGPPKTRAAPPPTGMSARAPRLPHARSGPLLDDLEPHQLADQRVAERVDAV